MKIYTSEVEMLRAQCKEWEQVCNQHLRHIKKLKKERTWVGLTDEEFQYCVELKNPESIAEEVEAKLKEKNTP